MAAPAGARVEQGLDLLAWQLPVELVARPAGGHAGDARPARRERRIDRRPVDLLGDALEDGRAGPSCRSTRRSRRRRSERSVSQLRRRARRMMLLVALDRERDRRGDPVGVGLGGGRLFGRDGRLDDLDRHLVGQARRAPSSSPRSPSAAWTGVAGSASRPSMAGDDENCLVDERHRCVVRLARESNRRSRAMRSASSVGVEGDLRRQRRRRAAPSGRRR